jgi:hypothetical protein
VNTGCSLRSLLQKPDRDPLQSLPAKAAIKVVNPELNRLAQNSVEIVEMVSVFLGLSLEPFRQCANSFSLLSLCLDPIGERRGLCHQRIFETWLTWLFFRHALLAVLQARAKA